MAEKRGLRMGKKYLNNLESHCHKHKVVRIRPDIVGTVYHLVICMQPNKVHKVF